MPPLFPILLFYWKYASFKQILGQSFNGKVGKAISESAYLSNSNQRLVGNKRIYYIIYEWSEFHSSNANRCG